MFNIISIIITNNIDYYYYYYYYYYMLLLLLSLYMYIAPFSSVGKLYSVHNRHIIADPLPVNEFDALAVLMHT